ncbi:MAG: 50S ribosomal protein L11 methyltransferase [Desulfobacterium sp.]|jgi:ribosomal protein L11 methyltransferase|nr:50S ribosomal protein L11 methyltransferase [Desulfobacterium sp.]
MRWIKINARFEAENMDLAEELVSQIFFDLDLGGLVCEVPLAEPDEGFGSNALEQPSTHSISGFLPDVPPSKNLIADLEKKAAALEGIKVTVSTRIVEDQDWRESWKNFFFVTRVTDTLVIRPSWREFQPLPNDIVIDIDPGMAFGTGTHETTSMCLALIQEQMTPGASFLDVGTGSGILMIAAAKLGAGTLKGLDNDGVAVEIAGKNLEQNKIPPRSFEISCTTLDQYPQERFDLLTANILAEVIIKILPEIKTRLAPKGRAILSGIINGWADRVKTALADNGFTLVKTTAQGEWVAMVVEKTRPIPEYSPGRRPE